MESKKKQVKEEYSTLKKAQEVNYASEFHAADEAMKQEKVRKQER
ncbi:YfhE family protein [Halalkalibacter oceani]|uniref:YfhE family protein n=1 Tax=Halalkalibacter oceani TaxID=1653776 RepID=A0A9X2DQM5_9BACI|nr:YfhE family protein [Halalkalibacter oceani]MCM3714375.1 YfhE family protein [Halalkalibacter oceani]